jgi:prolyl-tRNA synthetase
VNSEIIKEQNKCPQCGNKKLTEKKAIEVGNIFKLKTKYSVPFDLKFTDEKGRKKDVIMGCYGIGISRLMGAIIEVNNDNKGIIWPETVAPFKIHLIELNGASAKNIYEDLIKQGVEVLYDDRDISAGEKFADADLIGIPYRVVVSEKTGDKVELKKRGEKDMKLIDLKKLFEHVR